MAPVAGAAAPPWGPTMPFRPASHVPRPSRWCPPRPGAAAFLSGTLLRRRTLGSCGGLSPGGACRPLRRCGLRRRRCSRRSLGRSRLGGLRGHPLGHGRGGPTCPLRRGGRRRRRGSPSGPLRHRGRRRSRPGPLGGGGGRRRCLGHRRRPGRASGRRRLGCRSCRLGCASSRWPEDLADDARTTNVPGFGVRPTGGRRRRKVDGRAGGQFDVDVAHAGGEALPFLVRRAALLQGRVECRLGLSLCLLLGVTRLTSEIATHGCDLLSLRERA